MPINLIVNGYYRSGTTFFWKLLKESETYNSTPIYYEPLHPRLHYHIEREKRDSEPSLLHGNKIWGEYNQINECHRLKLLKNHPNVVGDSFINNKSKLFDYLDEFNSFNQKVILQTNRLHFFLDDCIDRYNSQIIHIIRNPHDVYLSMCKSSLKGNKWSKRLAKKVFKNKNEFFDLSREFDWINNRLGKNYSSFFSWKDRLKSIKSYDKFVVVYTLSNYYAIKSLNDKSLVIPYEYITASPKKTSIILKEYCGLEIVLNPENIINKRDSQHESFNKNFKRILEKYNIYDEYRYIQNYVSNNYKINYM